MGTRKRKRSESLRKSFISSISGIANAEAFHLLEFLEKYIPPLELPTLDLSNETHVRLKNAVIVPNESFRVIEKTHSRPRVLQSTSSLIDDVIWTLVQRRERNQYQDRNVLSEGCRMSSDFAGSGNMPTNTMRALTLNGTADLCRSGIEVSQLHQFLGDDALRAILLHTSLFLPVTNSSLGFLQICGRPLSRSRTHDRTTSKRRRKKLMEQNIPCPVELQSTVNVPRHTLFYSNSFVPKVGLPQFHILVRSQVAVEDLLDDILKLDCPLTDTLFGGFPCIRRNFRPICAEMLQKAKLCDFHRLIDRYCPIPALSAEANLADVSAAYSKGENAKSFVLATVKRIFPTSFWGSRKNQDVAFKHISTFILLRRRENYANKTLLTGMRTSQIQWLQRDIKNPSAEIHRCQTLLFLRAFRWTLISFVLPLLRSNFHITESEFSYSRLVFYRKPIWSRFRNLSMKKLLRDQYVEISQKDAYILEQKQQMGFSRLRLLPKLTGMRPIATLCKREFVCSLEDVVSRSFHSTKTTNAVLRDVFSILKYEYEQDPSQFGAGLHGLSQFHERYRPFIEQHRIQSGNSLLFFGSVDVKHCYDNVQQDRLERIVDALLRSEMYIIQGFDISISCGSLAIQKPRINRQQNVGPPTSFSTPWDFACGATEKLQNSAATVVVSEHSGSVGVTKSRIMELVEEHLHSHLVLTRGRYGERYLLQKNGIPQGSILSAHLCNFYYGKVEDDLLPGYTFRGNHDPSLLSRMIDDFLIVSSDPSAVHRFIEVMEQGDVANGVKINREKTLANVPTIVSAEKGLVQSKFFPWCGFLLSETNGEVRIDYSRLLDGRVEDSLRVEGTRNEGDRLRHQIKIFARPRCLPILYDKVINPKATQEINFYQMMVFTASRTLSYLKDSPVRFAREFVSRAVFEAIEYSYCLIQQRLRSCTFEAATSIRKGDAIWLGLKAFHSVFQESQMLDLASSFRTKDVPNSRSELLTVAKTAFDEMGRI